MTEATWDEGAKTPAIDWLMSAALENVPRGDGDMAEVTSLKGAVRAWIDLDPAHKAAAMLTVERAVRIDGASATSFTADGIAVLAERLSEATPSSAG